MTERIAKATEVAATTSTASAVEPKKTRKYVRKPKPVFHYTGREKKAVRTSTVLKSAETVQRLKERETTGRKKYTRYIPPFLSVIKGIFN